MAIHEECGLFGIYDASPEANVAMSTYFALYALQHRGHKDFQSFALPTELWHRAVKLGDLWQSSAVG